MAAPHHSKIKWLEQLLEEHGRRHVLVDMEENNFNSVITDILGELMSARILCRRIMEESQAPTTGEDRGKERPRATDIWCSSKFPRGQFLLDEAAQSRRGTSMCNVTPTLWATYGQGSV